MSMNPTNYSKPKEKMKTNFKAGTAFGRIIQILNVGDQHQTMWNKGIRQQQKLYWLPKEEQTPNKKQTVVENDSPVHSVMFKITVEFPKIRATKSDGTDGGPAWLSRDFKVSEKALAFMMESFDTNDLGELIEAPVGCQIDFTESGNAKIKSVSAAPEEVTVPEVEDKAKVVVFDFYNPDPEVFGKLYDWQKKIMQEALDFEGSKLQELMGQSTQSGPTSTQTGSDGFDDFEDDIPF